MKKKLLSTMMVMAVGAALLSGCGAAEGKEVEAPAETTTETTTENTENEAAAETAETAETEASAQTAENAETEGADDTVFTLGFDADFPPYGYVDDDGNYVGFDLDLAAEVCERLGMTLVPQPIDWDSKDMELTSGAIDCIWNGFTMTEERMDAYTWSKPYVDNSQVVVVAADSGIESLADLAGKVVCVQADSSALSALEDDDHKELTATFAELMQVPEYNTAFMNLESGAVDAIAMDIGVANYQITSRNADFKILDEKLVSELYGIGFKKGNTELMEKVQGALDEMAADGKLDEIATKWELQDTVILGK